MFTNSCVWAMESSAFHQFRADMTRFRPPSPLPSQGPADDAGLRGLPIQKVGRTAIVSLTGPILKSPPRWLAAYGIVGTRQVQAALQSAIADKGVESIVLRVDSPGGSVDGLAEFGDFVLAARQVKPVIAQVDGMAASAAYYVASQATKIYAGRMDLIGSIGTRLMLYDFSRAFEKEGVRAIPIDTGKYKSAGAMGTEITKEQQADFQRLVDAYFNDFVSTIVRGRGMAESQVRKVADGRVFTAAEALELGLIDGIQTIENTLRRASLGIVTQSTPRLTHARAMVGLLEIDACLERMKSAFPE